jgi:formyltetrahydrofolate deformylase
MNHEDRARLLVQCPDGPGIIAAVTGLLHANGANIIHSDQHATDAEGGRFFMRLEFVLGELEQRLRHLRQVFEANVARPFGMTWSVHPVAERKRAALFVSKADHALLELLWRWRRGELPMDVRAVVSNHPDLGPAVEGFGVPFVHVPTPAGARDQAEARLVEQLGDDLDLLVLARYMQVLSPAFVARYPGRIINIHHSFLPAFVGANPYTRAHERGVKLIGATAHYVTADLDQGPIIEQDVIRVSHRHDVADLKRLGADIERHVLARAVRWHLEDRVLVDGNKTIVFG